MQLICLCITINFSLFILFHSKGNRKKVTMMLCQVQDTLEMEECLAGI